MMAMSKHLSSYHIEALRVGALTADAAQSAQAHLGVCAACQGLQATIEANRAQFMAEVLPRTADALARAAARPSGPSRWFALALVPVAAGLLLFVQGARRPGPAPVEPAGPLIAKGGAPLQLVARRGERIFAVTGRTRLAAGDQLRFVVHGAEAPYVLIASIDGSGQASVYFPYRGTESARIEPAGRIELPGSVVLDHAAGPERVFALFSRAPLRAEAVTKALRELGTHGAPAIRAQERLPLQVAQQASVMFEKEVR